MPLVNAFIYCRGGVSHLKILIMKIKELTVKDTLIYDKG